MEQVKRPTHINFAREGISLFFNFQVVELWLKQTNLATSYNQCGPDNIHYHLTFY